MWEAAALNPMTALEKAHLGDQADRQLRIRSVASLPR
jgi:hypothetical protein